MAFCLGAALTAWSSYCIVACLRLSRRVDAALALGLVFLSHLILESFALSLLHRIGATGYLCCAAIVAAAAASFWAYQGRPLIPWGLPELWGNFAAWAKPRPGRRLLSCAVFIFFVVHFALTLLVLPRSRDAFSYHLPRAIYWLQNGTLDPFPTANPRQTIFPPDCSLTYLWSMSLLHSDRLVGMTSFGSYLAIMLAVWGLSRIVGATRSGAGFAVLVWSSLPQNLLGSSRATDHLLAAALPVVAIYFAVRASEEGGQRFLALSGMAVGISFGVKFLCAFSALSVGVVVLALAASRRRPARVAGWCAWCALWILLLGSWTYIENFRRQGDPLGGGVYANFRVLRPSVRITVANVARCSYQALDFSGPFFIDRPIHQALAKAAGWIGTGYDFNPPGSLSEEPFVPSQLVRRKSPDFAWFGPLLFLALIPCWMVSAWRRRPLARILLAAAAVYVIPLLVLLTWNPWMGRFYIFPVALGAPFLAILTEPQVGAGWRGCVVGLALMTILNLLVEDPDRSLKHLAGRPHEAAFKDLEPYGRLVPEVDRVIGSEPARIALVIGGDDLDYPFFGAGFRRHLLPVPPGTKVDPALLASMNAQWALVAPSRSSGVTAGGWTAVPLADGWTLLRRPR